MLFTGRRLLRLGDLEAERRTQHFGECSPHSDSRGEFCPVCLVG